MGNRLFIQVNSKKGAKPPKPIEIRRPGRIAEPEPPALPPAPVSMSSPEALAFFGGGEPT